MMQAWQDFVARPADYAVPDRLAACFDGALGDQTCDRLLATPRLRERLSDLLIERHGLGREVDQDALDPQDRAIALLPSDGLERLALRAGAVCHAGSLAGTIAGPRAVALRATLGGEIAGFALANRDLSAPDLALDESGDLRAQILAQGLACLEAWCATLPAPVAARVRLKLPRPEPDAPVSADMMARGPALLRKAAGA